MASVRARLRGVQVKLCLLITVLSFSLPAQPAEVFEETEEEAGVVAYPPLDRSGPRPLTIVLHGMCSEPERTCRHFASTLAHSGWLLCPRAKQRCEGGGSTWPQRGFEAPIERGVERVKARFPGELDEAGGRTLIGFSLGAFRALEMVQASAAGAGRYPRVLLIGAKIHPDAARLRAAGVERLLLAAGDWDMTRAHLFERARALVQRGFPASFQSYGPVGHAFPGNFPELLRRGLSWTRGDDGALAPGG